MNRAFFIFVSCVMVILSSSVWGKERCQNNNQDIRTLSFYHTHTREKLENIIYWRDGKYVDTALKKLNHFLRDHYTGDVTTYDPKVFDFLYELNQKLGKSGVYHVICGYRSPNTNNRLRKKSNQVARNSLHLQGKAIDVFRADVPLQTLCEEAICLQLGGVGYYKKQQFIHLDTGKVRSWGIDFKKD